MEFSNKNTSAPERLMQRLQWPADNSALILFRIIFGFLLFYHCVYFIYSGKVYANFIEPPFTFTYIGFEWLQPLPGNGMYYYFGLMALLGLLIMLGAWYRFAMAGFTVLWTLIYLMQKSNYNNHYYFILLICLLMCCMPANRNFSADVRRKPGIRSNSCPQYIPWLMMAQSAVMYFYAAIAKLNGDWLSGKFIALRFAPLSSKRIVGPLYASEYFQLMIVYGGFLFDLLVVPLLLWKKTRDYAFLLFCGFHIFNAFSFNIGIFPWLAIAMGIFFLPGAGLRKVLFENKRAHVPFSNISMQATAIHKPVVYLIAIYLLVQLLLPLRPAFYPGHVFWTEEGYRMSWKMMLRVKKGNIFFKITDPQSGQTWYDRPAARFTPGHVHSLAIAPDIIWQYAQRLKREYAGKGYPLARVFAIDSVSLNGSPLRLLIDTSVNLAAVKWQHFSHSKWIMPYKKP